MLLRAVSIADPTPHSIRRCPSSCPPIPTLFFEANLRCVFCTSLALPRRGARSSLGFTRAWRASPRRRRGFYVIMVNATKSAGPGRCVSCAHPGRFASELRLALARVSTLGRLRERTGRGWANSATELGLYVTRGPFRTPLRFYNALVLTYRSAVGAPLLEGKRMGRSRHTGKYMG